MKLFQVIQKKFTTLGINRSESSQKWLFNERIILLFVIFAYACTTSIIFLYKEAKTFGEYTININVTITLVSISFVFTIAAINIQNIFKFFDDFERIIDRGV